MWQIPNNGINLMEFDIVKLCAGSQYRPTRVGMTQIRVIKLILRF